MFYQVTIPILETLEQEAAAGGFAVIDDLGLYASSVISMFLIAAGIATFVYLVFGGINWITAGDDEQKVEQARSRITNALIGLVIVACSWAIFLIIDYYLGLNIAEP